ncbi:hypothetical protein BJX64DRAFT_87399 [Aspergillus heterothallicus]
MLRSLIDQVLHQFDFDMQYFQHTIYHAWHQDDLLILFEWLVRRLPLTQTLCCVIDAVALLECEKQEIESVPVLSMLVQLVNDQSVAAGIELLLTSTPSTKIVLGAFENEG